MIGVWVATWHLGLGVLLVAMGLGVMTLALRRAPDQVEDVTELEPFDYLDRYLLNH